MPAQPPVPTERQSDPAAVAIARAILALHAGPAALDSWTSKMLLAAYGVPVSRERMVQSRLAAAEMAAEEIGFPCALEHGGVVHGGLTDLAAVADAYEQISRAAGFAGAWLREDVPDGRRTRLRVLVRPRGPEIEGDAIAEPGVASLIARLAELAQDLVEEIVAIELDPVILLPDRIVALGASITTRRGNPGCPQR